MRNALAESSVARANRPAVISRSALGGRVEVMTSLWGSPLGRGQPPQTVVSSELDGPVGGHVRLLAGDDRLGVLEQGDRLGAVHGPVLGGLGVHLEQRYRGILAPLLEPGRRVRVPQL